MSETDRTPVIVGVGQVEDRSAPSETPLGALDLMEQAVQAAERDAGAALLVRTNWLGVVDALSWEKRPAPVHPDLTARLSLSPRHAETSPSPSGNYPVRLLNDAANGIAAGEIDVAVVVGGEAMRSMTRRAASTGGAASGSDMIRGYRRASEAELLKRYEVLTPLDVYPLYEQASRHAWDQTHAEATAESGAIWAAAAKVAAANPHAWLHTGWDAERITAPADDNPMLTWPYTRAMVANSGVNQGAAIIVASAQAARAAGVDEARFVTVGYGAAADEAAHNLMRASFDRSAAMEASLTAALELNELGVEDLDWVELYSCFPCVPKMARRIVGWGSERPSTVYGGLTFGGGPIGNCMSHALAEMTKLLRGTTGAGLVFANGGFATKNHSIILRGGLQAGREAKNYDVQARADRLRGAVPPLIEAYDGPAVLETFTVPFAKGRPRHANVLALTPTGTRCLCRVPASDEAMLGWLTSGADAVGALGRVVSGEDGLSIWRGVS